MEARLPPPVLSLKPCPANLAPSDAAALAAPHQTLESLVSQGEEAENRLQSARCAYENSARRDAYLLATGRQLKADLSDYLGRADAWQQAYGRLDRRLRDYYQHCLGEPLDDRRYQDCTAENAGLDAARTQLNDAAAPLQARNQELTAAVTKYRADILDSQLESAQTREGYTQATQGYARWLVQAYALSVTPAVQPYAGKNGCPAVAEPPQTPEAMLSLGTGMLDCFRKIMGAR
ncbi:MAG TPA: hypothetical protein VGT99_00955 [Gammaproteobacteria bacterium]|nr:hypothetical protein [Gammaproteobacteria bacterium]